MKFSINSKSLYSHLFKIFLIIFSSGMVDEAHIVWAMYCVENGFSNNSVDGFGDVLKRMCQTDPVSSKFQMGRTKLQYLVNHGLFPHFKQMILNEILKSPFMAVLFDESLNDSIQKSEMDILVRYWNAGENKVTVRYSPDPNCMGGGGGNLRFLGKKSPVSIYYDPPN